MASFRFQFVRADDLASEAIAWYSDGEFSHVDMVLDDGTLLGARINGGVLIRPQGYTVWQKQVIIEVPCTPLQKAVALEFANAQVGKPYDRTAIFAFVAARDWREPDAWFCSELGAATGEHGGFWPQLTSSVNRITPVGLALVCSATPGRTITVLK